MSEWLGRGIGRGCVSGWDEARHGGTVVVIFRSVWVV